MKKETRREVSPKEKQPGKRNSCTNESGMASVLSSCESLI